MFGFIGFRSLFPTSARSLLEDKIMSGLNLYPTPKSDITLNIISRLLGVGIVPSSILIFFAIYHNSVVASLAFPGTGGMGTAWLKIFLVNRVWGKILIPFYHFTVIAGC
jgi:hypothetical protein